MSIGGAGKVVCFFCGQVGSERGDGQASARLHASSRSTPRRKRIEVLIETFLRKQLGLKAHTVTKVEETEKFMVIDIDRLGSRLLRCGLRQRCQKVHSLQKPRGRRGLLMRKLPH